MSNQFTLNLEGRTVFVELRGTFDSNSCVALRAAVEAKLAEGAIALVVNLRHVTGIDSTAIGALLTLRRKISPSDLFRLCELPDRIDKVVRLSQLDGIFAIDALEESSRAEIRRHNPTAL